MKRLLALFATAALLASPVEAQTVLPGGGSGGVSSVTINTTCPTSTATGSTFTVTGGLFATSRSPVSGTSDTLLVGDCDLYTQYSNASNVAISVTPATLGAGFYEQLFAPPTGSGALVITTTAGIISNNGTNTFTCPAGSACAIHSDGTNIQMGVAVSGGTSTPGTSGQVLVSNGSGGFGTPFSLASGVSTLLGTTINALGGPISPTPTRAGDVLYWNGSAWTTLAGNNSGTNYFSENSTGTPAWAAGGGSGTPGGSSGQIQYNNAGAFGGLTNGQLPGEPSNGAASAGNIGEIATANASAVSINATAPTLITSASLTAGSWWCDGNFEPTLGASPTYLRVYIGTSTTPPTNQWLSGNQVLRNPSTSLYSNISVAISRIHFSLASTTTVGVYSDNSSATGNSVSAQLNCTRDH